MGLEVTELAAYLYGQVLAVHPAYEVLFEPFYPAGLRGQQRTDWAAGQLRKCICACSNLGTRNIPVLSGGFAWHMMYPWPQRPAGIIEEAFKELAARWKPLLDMAREACIGIPTLNVALQTQDQPLSTTISVDWILRIPLSPGDKLDRYKIHALILNARLRFLHRAVTKRHGEQAQRSRHGLIASRSRRCVRKTGSPSLL